MVRRSESIQISGQILERTWVRLTSSDWLGGGNRNWWVLHIGVRGSYVENLSGSCGRMWLLMVSTLALLDRSTTDLPIGGVHFLNQLLDTIDLELVGLAVHARNFETIGRVWWLVHRMNSFGASGFWKFCPPGFDALFGLCGFDLGQHWYGWG